MTNPQPDGALLRPKAEEIVALGLPKLVLVRHKVAGAAKRVLIRAIGINEEGIFGLVPIKEETNERASDSFVSDSSSIASPVVPQMRKPSSITSFRAELGITSGGVVSRNRTPRAGTRQPRNALPDTLPTPPSEKIHVGRETGIGVVKFGNEFSDNIGEKEYLSSPDEILYMQVFMEKVGIWMDLLDRNKHFSRIIPFLALKSPMLLNAFLACGVKHLTLTNQVSKDGKALLYYDTSTTQLLRNLQNPDRNMTECATTAVVLNVYEIMSEEPNDRMSHIAGARALIRECGWNAQSEGIGAACFWLNIGMEVLSCLSFNWPTAWDPNHWGLDLGFVDDFVGRSDKRAIEASAHRGDGNKDQPDDEKRVAEAPTDNTGDCADEVWTHRMFYIVAKIANFRANIPRFQEPSPHVEQLRLQNRFTEWKLLKSLCDGWNRECPRSMKPFGYLYPTQISPSGSVFPKVCHRNRLAHCESRLLQKYPQAVFLEMALEEGLRSALGQNPVLRPSLVSAYTFLEHNQSIENILAQVSVLQPQPDISFERQEALQ
ncbi:c6 zinc finger domain containing protein [Grosmannia clavigera kw1407]|uniref:C6 zinc finger domain containing protein n=1 Tax=Grosmannia clavigera (strain kw1407 / UAMH 11150) TaxID=655863 RepID=F0XSN7_GROCL|nr:c6 zinc finger domain containing protein [Grosmannia clavigera kw1407]EFW99326.1 c6 zinc finger domain containing protein [Grosmannia clavigera kw1407]